MQGLRSDPFKVGESVIKLSGLQEGFLVSEVSHSNFSGPMKAEGGSTCIQRLRSICRMSERKFVTDWMQLVVAQA